MRKKVVHRLVCLVSYTFKEKPIQYDNTLKTIVSHYLNDLDCSGEVYLLNDKELVIEVTFVPYRTLVSIADYLKSSLVKEYGDVFESGYTLESSDWEWSV